MKKFVVAMFRKSTRKITKTIEAEDRQDALAIADDLSFNVDFQSDAQELDHVEYEVEIEREVRELEGKSANELIDMSNKITIELINRAKNGENLGQLEMLINR